MIIKTLKIKAGTIFAFRILSLEKCCDELIQSKNICINNDVPENIKEYNYLNPEYSVKIVREEESYDIDNDFTISQMYFEKMKYCPFCGKEIIIIIEEEIDKTEEFNNLEKERKILWNKYVKSVSKKKSELLQSKVSALDKKINKIIQSDEYLNKDYS